MELAFLSLQLKEQFIAEECVKELKTIDDTVSGLNAPKFCNFLEQLIITCSYSEVENNTPHVFSFQCRMLGSVSWWSVLSVSWP